MKISSPNFTRLFTPELKQLVSLFERHSYELRIAGGAVRDLLLGNDPCDIDFATIATPHQMKDMFEAESIRMINNKGEKHGTITARINEQNFEVTTLRIDVLTDGRHAQVEFTEDWQLDANRRDLTINAMFLGFDGTVYDYFNGTEDLDKRIVRFVGVASERIQEDFLRILRYFRFHGRISPEPCRHEASTLQAIRENAHGLSGISGERLWVEIKKIVTGGHSYNLLECMAEHNVTSYLGLPEKLDVVEYREVYQRSKGMHPHSATMIAALLTGDQDVDELNGRVKMSNDEVGICNFIIRHRGDDLGGVPHKYFQDIYTDSCVHHHKLLEQLGELLKYRGEKRMLEWLEAWTPLRFCVTGYDLLAANVPKGAMFGKTLSELKRVWRESEYRLTKDELVARIPEVVHRCP